MKKSKLIDHFETSARLARFMGLSRQAVHVWPETLDQRLADEVLGRLIRKKVLTTWGQVNDYLADECPDDRARKAGL